MEDEVSVGVSAFVAEYGRVDGRIKCMYVACSSHGARGARSAHTRCSDSDFQVRELEADGTVVDDSFAARGWDRDARERVPQAGGEDVPARAPAAPAEAREKGRVDWAAIRAACEELAREDAAAAAACGDQEALAALRTVHKLSLPALSKEERAEVYSAVQVRGTPPSRPLRPPHAAPLPVRVPARAREC